MVDKNYEMPLVVHLLLNRIGIRQIKEVEQGTLWFIVVQYTLLVITS